MARRSPSQLRNLLEVQVRRLNAATYDRETRVQALKRIYELTTEALAAEGEEV